MCQGAYSFQRPFDKIRGFMKFIIMCGGVYSMFEKHKALTEINGEKLVERTIRLLRENGIEEIYISATDEAFDEVSAPRIVHENSFKVIDGVVQGYWVDAYAPSDEPTTYLHGDVYYTENAIKQIINLHPKKNTFMGNKLALNEEHKNWGEPYGWIIVDPKEFRDGINKTKKLQDEGKLTRGYALSWELYRVLNGLDPNEMYINKDTYFVIDDGTCDIDSPWQIEELRNKVANNEL